MFITFGQRDKSIGFVNFGFIKDRTIGGVGLFDIDVIERVGHGVGRFGIGIKDGDVPRRTFKSLAQPAGHLAGATDDEALCSGSFAFDRAAGRFKRIGGTGQEDFVTRLQFSSGARKYRFSRSAERHHPGPSRKFKISQLLSDRGGIREFDRLHRNHAPGSLLQSHCPGIAELSNDRSDGDFFGAQQVGGLKNRSNVGRFPHEPFVVDANDGPQGWSVRTALFAVHCAGQVRSNQIGFIPRGGRDQKIVVFDP